MFPTHLEKTKDEFNFKIKIGTSLHLIAHHLDVEYVVPEYPALVPDADGEVPGPDLPLVDQPEPALGRVSL